MSLVREQEGEAKPVPVVVRGAAQVCGQKGTDMALGLVRRDFEQVPHCSLKLKCV